MSIFGVVDVPKMFTPPPVDERGRAYAWYVHHYSAYLLAWLIALHVAATLWHEIMLGDGLLARMSL